MKSNIQKDKKTDGGIALLIMLPIIIALIYLLYHGWDFYLGGDISPDDTTKFFFKSFLRKMAILFSI